MVLLIFVVILVVRDVIFVFSIVAVVACAAVVPVNYFESATVQYPSTAPAHPPVSKNKIGARSHCRERDRPVTSISLS